MIRRCKKEDLNEVLRIERICFNHPYDYSTFLYFLINDKNGFYIAKKNNQIVGYIIASVRGDKGTLVSIAVLPEFRRKGIGSRLMRESLAYLSRKVNYVELQVRVSNFEAINFYKKFGFEEIGFIPNYYIDGEDALIMLKRLRFKGK
ncbi:MAG: ribosomal protein S18-alanine N-acetyltransferase [Nitrososphaerales archaeon]